MSETPKDAIRRMLKTFGIQADEAISAHLAQGLDIPEIHLRISLIDLTDYGDQKPEAPLTLEVEGGIPTESKSR